MTSVFAGNLSWEVNESELIQHLSIGGAIKAAEIIRFADGRSKGWALVHFEDANGAASAIAQCNETELLGRKILLREDRESSKRPPRGKKADRGGGGGGGLMASADVPLSGTNLFVGNLPWSTTSQQLREVFSEYNVKIAEVKAGYDGRSRGYGIVSFDSEEDAAAALTLGGYNLDGREILVRFDKQPGE